MMHFGRFVFCGWPKVMGTSRLRAYCNITMSGPQFRIDGLPNRRAFFVGLRIKFFTTFDPGGMWCKRRWAKLRGRKDPFTRNFPEWK